MTCILTRVSPGVSFISPRLHTPELTHARTRAATAQGKTFRHKPPKLQTKLAQQLGSQEPSPVSQANTPSAGSGRVNPLEAEIARAAPVSSRQSFSNGNGPIEGRPNLGRKQSLSQLGRSLMSAGASTPSDEDEDGPNEFGARNQLNNDDSNEPELPSGSSAPRSRKQSEQSGGSKRFSLLSTLRGRKVSTASHSPELASFAEAPASPRSPDSNGRGKGKEKVRLVKVKVVGKKTKEFNSLFLAQQLAVPSSPSAHSPNPSPPLASGASAHSASHSFQHVSSAAPGAQPIWVTKWSPDGRHLAVGGQGGIVRVWRVLDSPEERSRTEGVMPVFAGAPLEFCGHESDVLDICWSKGSKFFLSSSMDQTVRLWHLDRHTGGENDCLCAFQHLNFVTSIAFHPKNDKYFLSGSMDHKLRLWGIVEKKVIRWTELPEVRPLMIFSLLVVC